MLLFALSLLLFLTFPFALFAFLLGFFILFYFLQADFCLPCLGVGRFVHLRTCLSTLVRTGHNVDGPLRLLTPQNPLRACLARLPLLRPSPPSTWPLGEWRVFTCPFSLFLCFFIIQKNVLLLSGKGKQFHRGWWCGLHSCSSFLPINVLGTHVQRQLGGSI